mmetsp:Transcript_4741/g.6719  ORF Transcript_4741/g.6719 Transcript_4741/m.6719 type:complete len:505 (-) Transcript_4741:415-1929(-)
MLMPPPINIKEEEGCRKNMYSPAESAKTTEIPRKEDSSTNSSQQISYYDNIPLQRTESKAKALCQRSELTANSQKLLLVLVGIPARGKSFISAKLYSFLNWLGYKTRVFNVGQHRRAMSGDTKRATSQAAFFDTTNKSAKEQREAIAMEVLDQVIAWYASSERGEIAIFDATNSTLARRKAIRDRCPNDISIVFIESICDDPQVLEQNMIAKVRASPDFKGLHLDEAMADLRRRISNYEAAYETITDSENISYVKLFNFSSKVTVNNCFGRMSKTILPFLMATHSNDRPIYLTALVPRRREPEYYQDTCQSQQFCLDFEQRLAEWWWKKKTANHTEVQRVQVFTSTMPGAIDAGLAFAKHAPHLVQLNHTSALNPLLLGVSTPPNSSHDFIDLDSSNYSIRSNVSSDTRQDIFDRGNGGESYYDLIQRLESACLDIEASVDPVLIITHATPARALRAYFKNIDVVKCMGQTTSPETRALADSEPAVLELIANFGGGFIENVHFI